MAVITLTDENFEEEVVSCDVPVLVDYWAEWCGPCKMVGPLVEELAEEFSEKLKVGKLDVDQNKLSAARQNVMSIPTLLIFYVDFYFINDILPQLYLNICLFILLLLYTPILKFYYNKIKTIQDPNWQSQNYALR